MITFYTFISSFVGETVALRLSFDLAEAAWGEGFSPVLLTRSFGGTAVLIVMPLQCKDFIVEEEVQIKTILHKVLLAAPVFCSMNKEFIIWFLELSLCREETT